MKFGLTETDIFSIAFSQNGSNKVLNIPYFCFEIKVLKILKKLIFQGIQFMKFSSLKLIFCFQGTQVMKFNLTEFFQFLFIKMAATRY